MTKITIVRENAEPSKLIVVSSSGKFAFTTSTGATIQVTTNARNQNVDLFCNDYCFDIEGLKDLKDLCDGLIEFLTPEE